MTMKRLTKLYIGILRTNMSSLEFKLRKIEETRNLKEIKHKGVMNEKHKKICKYLNHIENLLIFV